MCSAHEGQLFPLRLASPSYFRETAPSSWSQAPRSLAHSSRTSKSEDDQRTAAGGRYRLIDPWTSSVCRVEENRHYRQSPPPRRACVCLYKVSRWSCLTRHGTVGQGPPIQSPSSKYYQTNFYPQTLTTISSKKVRFLAVLWSIATRHGLGDWLRSSRGSSTERLHMWSHQGGIRSPAMLQLNDSVMVEDPLSNMSNIMFLKESSTTNRGAMIARHWHTPLPMEKRRRFHDRRWLLEIEFCLLHTQMRDESFIMKQNLMRLCRSSNYSNSTVR